MLNGNLRQRLRHKPICLRCPSTRSFSQSRLCSEPHKTPEFLPLSPRFGMNLRLRSSVTYVVSRYHLQVPIDTCRAGANSRSSDDCGVTPRLRNERKVDDSELQPGDGGAWNLHPIEALIRRMSSPFRSLGREELQFNPASRTGCASAKALTSCCRRGPFARRR